MRILRGHLALKNNKKQVVAAIGCFDALHLGHQQLIRQLVAEAKNRNAESLLFSFYRHPAEVLRNQKVLPLLSFREKISKLKELGVQNLCLLRFTKDLSQLSAEDFLENFLHKPLRLKGLVLGSDAKVGKGAEGDITFIESFFNKKAYPKDLIYIQEFSEFEGKKIGSRQLREAILTGDLEFFKATTARNFAISGKVVRGDRRGGKIGFPTANIIPGMRALPPKGVYAAKVILPENREFDAVVNLGNRPTFGGEKVVLEAHLLNYEGADFYSQCIQVNFIKFIRAEQRFSGIEELVKQIAADVTKARNILENE